MLAHPWREAGGGEFIDQLNQITYVTSVRRSSLFR